MSLYFALRETSYRGSVMINLCDADLLGKKLEQGDLVIELTEGYFKERIIDIEEARKLLKKCAIANLVGEGIVKEAISLKLAKVQSIKRISGVPFLMIFKFQHSY